MSVKRLLIVEDDPAVAELFRAVTVRDPAITARIAPTLADAINECKEFKPDVILLDLMLPDVPVSDPCAGIRALRSDGINSREAAIVAISGDGGLRDEAIAAGATRFTAKPPKVESLLGEIDRAFYVNALTAITAGLSSQT